MNTLDYIIIGIVAVAALRCWFRGIIGEVLSAAALVGGLLAGILFYRPIATWLTTLVDLGSFALPAGFVLSFAVVFIAVKIIEKSLRGILESFKLDILDRVFGLLFGAVEGLVIVAVLLLVIKYQPVFDTTALLADSTIAGIILPVITEHLPNLEG
jgi:membrane protein required for colicin V production